jgi:hypothetical protein
MRVLGSHDRGELSGRERVALLNPSISDSFDGARLELNAAFSSCNTQNFPFSGDVRHNESGHRFPDRG